MTTASQTLRSLLILLPAAAMIACGTPEPTTDTVVAPEDLIDNDGDQYFANANDPSQVDCDDNDPNSYPGADEICDNLDNNCNDVVDENALEALDWFRDRDGDGFASSVAEPESFCFRPEGYTSALGDCNDDEPTVFPGAPELCDELDNNCDFSIDEGLDTETIWYLDADRDGFGAGKQVGTGCTAEQRWVDNADDCNDAVANTNPDADEICDGIDNDCDGAIDDADTEDPVGAPLWYTDQDFDGYGDIRFYQYNCEPPVDDGVPWVRNFDDCAPDDPNINPETEWYEDLDVDGFGNGDVRWPTGPHCWQPIGYAPNTGDCDDQNPEEWKAIPWYPDADGDGFGGPDPVAYGCDPDPGWSSDNTDCDDRKPEVNINGTEACNGYDDDCDGAIDDDDIDQLPLGTTTYFFDNDEDGFGAPFPLFEFCEPPTPQFVTDNTDCADNVAELNPTTLWFADTDFDGYGDPNAPYAGNPSCQVVPGHAINTDDCDDSDFFQHDFQTWWLDLDQDGIGAGVEPTSCGCRYSDFLSLESGDCDDNDASNTDNTCYGDDVGSVSLTITVDNDAAGLSIRWECVGQGAVESISFTAAEALTTQLVAFPLATGTECQMVVTDSTDDASGDGSAEIDVRICGSTVDNVSHLGTFEAYGTYVTTRCSGCTDPAAFNFDNTAIVSDPDACFYTDDNICVN
ncbi:MAG: putative metal-binding motif-containing protein [Myxococcota bacterium]